jgi:pyruvate ferredoxin oxidoreductase alpha subunit
VELLPDDCVKTFVGDYRIPHSVLDVGEPTTQGPFAMPDYYYELRCQQATALRAASRVFAESAAEFALLTGRLYSDAEEYRLEDASRALVALGSTAGTIKDVIDEVRDAGMPVGLLKLVSFRPFPTSAVASALADVDSVTVLDRSDSPGGTPALHAELAAALYGSGVDLTGAVYGLGGRDLHPADIRAVIAGPAPAYVGLRGEPCPA